MKKTLKKGFTLIELMIVVAIIGILAAIAIPNFVKFQARSKQGEAKTNLKALFTAEKSYYAEKDQYITDMNVIGFNPEQGNRYSYQMASSCDSAWDRPGAAPSGTINCIHQDSARFGTTASGTAPSAVNWTTVAADYQPDTAGTSGSCPQCGFAAQAVGNIDNDTNLDSWFIGTGTSAGTNGTATGLNPDNRMTAGVSFNDVSDLGD